MRRVCEVRWKADVRFFVGVRHTLLTSRQLGELVYFSVKQGTMFDNRASTNGLLMTLTLMLSPNPNTKFRIVVVTVFSVIRVVSGVLLDVRGLL